MISHTLTGKNEGRHRQQTWSGNIRNSNATTQPTQKTKKRQNNCFHGTSQAVNTAALNVKSKQMLSGTTNKTELSRHIRKTTIAHQAQFQRNRFFNSRHGTHIVPSSNRVYHETEPFFRVSSLCFVGISVNISRPGSIFATGFTVKVCARLQN